MRARVRRGGGTERWTDTHRFRDRHRGTDSNDREGGERENTSVPDPGKEAGGGRRRRRRVESQKEHQGHHPFS